MVYLISLVVFDDLSSKYSLIMNITNVITMYQNIYLHHYRRNTYEISSHLIK